MKQPFRIVGHRGSGIVARLEAIERFVEVRPGGVFLMRLKLLVLAPLAFWATRYPGPWPAWRFNAAAAFAALHGEARTAGPFRGDVDFVI